MTSQNDADEESGADERRADADTDERATEPVPEGEHVDTPAGETDVTAEQSSQTGSVAGDEMPAGEESSASDETTTGDGADRADDQTTGSEAFDETADGPDELSSTREAGEESSTDEWTTADTTAGSTGRDGDSELAGGDDDGVAAVESHPRPGEEAALDRIRFVARVLDESIPIPGLGFRIGLDPLLGVLPVAGDLVTGVLSLYIVAEAVRLDVSTDTLVKMVLNITADVVIGSIPLVGDLFDAAWKANVRNVDLVVDDLERAG